MSTFTHAMVSCAPNSTSSGSNRAESTIFCLFFFSLSRANAPSLIPHILSCHLPFDYKILSFFTRHASHFEFALSSLISIFLINNKLSSLISLWHRMLFLPSWRYTFSFFQQIYCHRSRMRGRENFRHIFFSSSVIIVCGDQVSVRCSDTQKTLTIEWKMFGHTYNSGKLFSLPRPEVVRQKTNRKQT